MKKIVMLCAVALLALTAVLPTSALALDASADAYVSVYSKYLWRGFDLSPDDSFVVQPGADVSMGGFTVSWWGNVSENDGNMNEVDLVLDYSFDIGEMVSMSVGNIMYDVDGVKDTNELYVGATLNTILEPSLTVYYDYDEFKTLYTTLGIGHGYDINDQVSIGVGVTASYLVDDEDDGFGTDDSWLHNLEISAGVGYTVTEQVSLSLDALYSLPLSDDAEDNTGIDDEATVGLTATFAF
ncbi:MAG: hypothetical protein C0616_08775 [Desulfuromonas sp.]|nr:MAG: hypothetical protein C0616_08775 [Desulfuromonas sp.]